eukprot:m.220375 g.220375  ORF g.220375 m.220375 type:complete len:409 (-) comp19159_c0_seq1:182-1408(-)
MADVETAAGELAENITELVNNASNASISLWDLNRTEVVDLLHKATQEFPEGMLLAYTMLLLMAIIPIYVGSHLSVVQQEKQKNKDEDTEEVEVMTSNDAMMFPLVASCALFGLYVLFKVFGKEYVNLLMGGYFFILGVMSLTKALRSFVLRVTPASFTKLPFTFSLTQEVDVNAKKTEETKEEKTDTEKEASKDTENDGTYFLFKFDYVDLVCLALASAVGGVYLYSKNWVANNLFGISFCVNGIEMFSLGSFQTGCILLSGLFIYDVFWVFGTDVMVTVAKSFDAPIKVLFPKDFMINGIFAKEFAMLGLGDIVLPGVVIALLLRFDKKEKHRGSPYFHATYIAYILGLMTTIIVMQAFKAAQPALLYLVPACLTTPILLSLARGEFGKLMAYSEEDEEDSKEKKTK